MIVSIKCIYLHELMIISKYFKLNLWKQEPAAYEKPCNNSENNILKLIIKVMKTDIIEIIQTIIVLAWLVKISFKLSINLLTVVFTSKFKNFSK